MNSSFSDKDRLLSKLAGIYDQLEELDEALKASFSELRIELDQREQDRLLDSAEKITKLERITDQMLLNGEMVQNPLSHHSAKSLKLEMGF
ncbi:MULTISPECIES: hypothetical protein [Neobacillus]|uniref:Uncharacterized protein n=1 Tax=Neobacillus citreus TaxID=2833578 RepID=A0A942YB25_9BACI|nr:hypothetical protein [Neobacillus citreus]MCH6268523.1 hypothetical protein [Neobacillus citreus]